MSAILFLLTGGYLLWIAAYLFHERNSRRKKAEKAGQILTRMAVDVSEILGKSTFSLSHSTQATGIRFEDMGLAVRVAVSGEAASEEERIQAGKTLAELRNTPMFEQLTSGDAKREERNGSAR